MAAPQLLCRLFDIGWSKTAMPNEIRLLEAEITVYLVTELKAIFRVTYSDWFQLIKFQPEGEQAVLDNQFLRRIIQDILQTGDYTLEGIVRYTGFHEDLIHEVAAGLNTHPSLYLFQRLVELHKTVRRDLYEMLRRKIVDRILQKNEIQKITERE